MRSAVKNTRSPLAESEASGLDLIVFLLFLLSVVLGLGAVLIWTRDEQAGAFERGFWMVGLGVFALSIAQVLRWRVRRMRARAATEASAPAAGHVRADPGQPAATAWRRLRLGPAWTDWLALLMPLILIGLPLFLLAKRKDLETFAGIGLIVLIVELLVLAHFFAARREPVALALVPGAVLVTYRSGRTRLVRREELARVVLDAQAVRGFAFGRLLLEIHGAKPIVLREPMERPLPEIGQQVADHLGSELVM